MSAEASVFVFLRTLSRTTTKSRGDKIHPCRPPLSTWNVCIAFHSSRCNRHHDKAWISPIIFSDTPIFFRSVHIAYVFMVSRDRSKPMNNIYNGDFHSTDCSIIMRSGLLWSTHDLLGLKPFCSIRSVVFKADASLPWMMKASALTTEFKTVIPRQE